MGSVQERGTSHTHARQNPGTCDLFMLHGFNLKMRGSRVNADGGTPLVLASWNLKAGTLEALAYEFRLPEE